jgi:hypothetical protein
MVFFDGEEKVEVVPWKNASLTLSVNVLVVN